MHPAVAISAGLAGIFAVAIIATLVSKQAQTPSVVGTAFTGLGYVIQSAVSPVTGTTPSLTSGNQLGNSSGNYLTSPLGGLMV